MRGPVRSFNLRNLALQRLPMMVGRENILVTIHGVAPKGVVRGKARKEIVPLLVVLLVGKEKERVNPDPLLLNQAVPVKARIRVLAGNGRTLAAVRAVKTVNTAMLGRETQQILFAR